MGSSESLMKSHSFLNSAALSLVISIFVFLVAAVQNSRGAEPVPGDDAKVPAWVRDRVASLQPRPDEKRLDEIGWTDDIRHALRLAKEHQRPVFLFTHDGRINLGRC